jgi:hypothetical protein
MRLRTLRTVRTGLVAALSAALVAVAGLGPASAASEGELYDSGVTPQGTLVADSATFLGSRFQVPAGQEWTLTSVRIGSTVESVSLNFGPDPTTEIAFFADERTESEPDLTPEAQRTASLDRRATQRNTFRFDDPVVLDSGVYWVGFSEVAFGLAPSSGAGVLVVDAEGSVLPSQDPPFDLDYTLNGTSRALTIGDSLALYDALTADGTLTAAGPGRSAQARFAALRNMLVTATDLETAGDLSGACDQLADAGQRLGTDETLPASHFATGPGADELEALLEEIRTAVCG